MTSCQEEEPPVVVDEPVDECAAANDTGEWGYDNNGGPACWGSVCSHGACDGNAQSPINITGADTNTTLPFLSLVGGFTRTDIVNNGHTVKFNVNPGSFVSYGTLPPDGYSNEFTLGQFHFHGNSEHTVDGSRAPLEAHFVHRSVWGDNYLVLSVLFEAGAENTFLAQFDSHLPTDTDGTYNNDTLTFSPYSLIPTDRSYYKYTGSLTTPPCTETVTWIVFQDKVEASQAQLDAYNALLTDNYRPTQDLNGRVIDFVVQ